MAIPYFDALTNYTDATDMGRANWFTNGSIGTYGGSSWCRLVGAGGTYLRRFITPQSAFYMGVRLRPVLSGGPSCIFRVYDSATAKTHLGLFMDSSRRLIVGLGLQTECETPGNGLPNHTPLTSLWQAIDPELEDVENYYELGFNINDTTGAWTLRRNNVVVTSQSGVDTRNGTATTADEFIITRLPNLTEFNLRDFYLSDSAFQNERKVTTRRPSSDNSVALSRSSGSNNYALVNEVTADDTSYVYASTSPLTDLYGMPSMPANVASTAALRVVSRQSKTDAGTATSRIELKSGATTAESADINPGTSPGYYWKIWETDPNTGSGWTPSNAGAALPGIKRTA